MGFASSRRSFPAALALCAVLASGVGPVPLAAAAIPLQSQLHSPDIAGLFGGVLVRDEDVAVDDLMSGTSLLSLGILPVGADVDAVAEEAGGAVLLSLDTHAALGGLAVSPADVVRWDGVAFTLVFDAAAAGVPAGADADAVAVDPASGDLLLSFDATLALGAITAADEDLARWDGVAWSLFFDGSTAGIPSALDVDAAHLQADGTLLVSFDTPGAVDGVSFHDEDVLAFDLGTGDWSIAVDGSVLHFAWVAADLDALAARGVLSTPTPTLAPTATSSATPTPTSSTTPAPALYEIPTLDRRGLMVLAILLGAAALVAARRR
jgi:hypothetical protein